MVKPVATGLIVTVNDTGRLLQRSSGYGRGAHALHRPVACALYSDLLGSPADLDGDRSLDAGIGSSMTWFETRVRVSVYVPVIVFQYWTVYRPVRLRLGAPGRETPALRHPRRHRAVSA